MAEELAAAREKAARAAREEAIRRSIQGVEQQVAARAREQAYRDAVGQVAARLGAGQVKARVGGGGSGTEGLGPAQAAAYSSRIAQLIRRHWHPNCSPASNLKNLKAVIVVRLAADGSITASWLEKSSGDRLFDQSAMNAVSRANPLPPLPPGRHQLEIGITFSPEWKTES